VAAKFSPTRSVTLDRHDVVRYLFIVCVSLELLFVALDYHLYMANLEGSRHIRSFFNVAREDSLASWTMMLQTILVALTTWAIWALARLDGKAWERRCWMVIALFFTYLAADDGSFIHERIGSWFDNAAGATEIGARLLDVFPSYRWQLVYMPWFVLMGMFIFAFLVKVLPDWKPKAMVLIAFACLAFAVGMDFFEGLEDDHAANPYAALTASGELDYWAVRTFDQSAYDTLRHLSKTLEECLEMFAFTLLWMVLLQHLMRRADGTTIRFGARARPQGSPVAATPIAATQAKPPRELAA
jgi:hypothetical protein